MITLLLSLLILVSGNDGGVTKRTLLGLFSTDQKQESEKYQSRNRNYQRKILLSLGMFGP